MFKSLKPVSGLWLVLAIFSNLANQSVAQDSTPLRSALEVQLAGDQRGYGPSANARPGDAINGLAFLESTSPTPGVKPHVTLVLGPLLSYVPNSLSIRIKRDNKNQDINLSDDKVRIDGTNVTFSFDDIAPNVSSAIYVYFKLRVADASQFVVGETPLQLYSLTSFTGAKEVAQRVPINVAKDANPIVSFDIRTELANRTLDKSFWISRRAGIASPSDIIAYDLTVINTGNFSAKNVKIKTVLPPGIVFNGNAMLMSQDNKIGVPVAGETLFGEGFTIPVVNNGTGGYKEIMFEARVTNPALVGNEPKELRTQTQVVHQGKVVAQNTATLLVSRARGLLVNIYAQDPATGVFKKQIGPLKLGQLINYRVIIQNNSDVSFVNPLVHVTLPEQLSYVSGSFSIDFRAENELLQRSLFTGGITLTDETPGFCQQLDFQALVNTATSTDTLTSTSVFVKAQDKPEVMDNAKALLTRR